jgi:uncharacterized protein (DUF1800 family)
LSLRSMNRTDLQHLLFRASFGMSSHHIYKYEGMSRATVVDELLKESEDTTPFDVNLSDFLQEAGRISRSPKKDLGALIKSSKQKFLQLNNQWMTGVFINKEELRERMLLFWANHFVCRDSNVYHMQLYLNCLKENALGNFRELVKAVSKQPAMLKYLNGRQNRKNNPNENFARELMELFTLGEGKYSEQDVRESARAFTGYNHNFKGDFVWRRWQHDLGQKTFLGQKGPFNGDDIVDIILSQKACASFICSKVYAYFVNPQINEEHIRELADVFYKDYDIAGLMHYLFNRDWFYQDENKGVKIKSPVDVLAGMYRLWPYELTDETAYVKIQKLLGQSLLDPPNVAGWPGDRAWIDTNTLMIRLKLPSLIYNLRLNDDMSSGMRGIRKNPIKARYNPDYVTFHYPEFTTDSLSRLVISEKIGQQIPLNHFMGKSRPLALVRLMSLPEFQLS